MSWLVQFNGMIIWSIEQTAVKFESNINNFIEEIGFENIICQMSAILFSI